MERYAKLFAKAALTYLIIGVILGISMGGIPNWVGKLRFAHIHLNLLGFMTMMIASVAYHVIPRFNARPLPWPAGVKYHFFLHNIGLLGLITIYPFGGLWKSGLVHVLFILFSITTGAGLFIMVYNLYGALIPNNETNIPNKITGDMKVGAILSLFPNTLPIFIENGFKTLSNPVARETFAKVISLEKACEKHGVPLIPFLEKLNRSLDSQSLPPTTSASKIHESKKISWGEHCDKSVMVGSLIKTYADTKAVFEKHYGEGCFACPGQAIETVEQTAQMHNVSLDLILKEINCVIDLELSKRN